jgi:hypothetical protein
LVLADPDPGSEADVADAKIPRLAHDANSLDVPNISNESTDFAVLPTLVLAEAVVNRIRGRNCELTAYSAALRARLGLAGCLVRHDSIC